MALFVLHNFILQSRMRSHPVGLDVWILIGPFVYFHTLCVRTAKALARLRGCGKTIDLYCYIKVLKVKPVYQQMTLSPKLGVVGISTIWHFRLPLPIQMFIKVASSPRLSGIGMPSPILWSHPLKMQRIVLLSSLLWWELGTNSLITGPGEWLSFRRFTSKLSWSWSWAFAGRLCDKYHYLMSCLKSWPTL